MCAALGANAGAQARRGAPPSGGVQGGRVGLTSPPPAASRAVPDDPFSGPVVTNAPFSADAITTVTQILGDGTRIEQRTTSRFYRDSAGRVRREQTILGLDALNPSNQPRTVITVDPDPNDAFAYTLDPSNRTARRVRRATGPYADAISWIVGDRLAGTQTYFASVGLRLEVRRRVTNGAPEAPGAEPVEESLGTRQIEGVSATGHRTKTTIPTGVIGNDRPIEITDERWESAELRLLVRSLHHDPRTGDVEYRLTNINRVEPPADLFAIPPDYAIPDAAGAGARTGGGGGQRTGGAGQRSGGGR
jgi:hypothetical protein